MIIEGLRLWKKKTSPVKTDAERKDRLRYYAEQKRLRQIEQEEPLTPFDKAALRDYRNRMAKGVVSIDKELK